MAVWREIAAALGVGARVDQGRVPAGLHATRSATLQAGKDPIGAVGEIDPDVLASFDVTERVAIARARPRRGARPRARSRRRGSRSAAIRRATSTWRSSLADDVPAEKLEKAIRQGAGDLLVDLELFDVYRGPGVGDGRRSLAYRLRLQAPDRNLTDADIAEVRRARGHGGGAKLGAELRG